MNTKKLSIILLVVGLFAVSVGAAAAQEGNPPPPPVGEEGNPPPFGGRGENGMRPPRGGGPRGDIIRAALEAAAAETGLDAQGIILQLGQGTSLADIVTTNGGNVQAVIDAAVATATDEINSAAADGRIPQERADEMLTHVEDIVTQAVNGELHPGAPGRDGFVGGRPGIAPAFREGRRILIDAITEQTGLDGQEIREQIVSGKTLADVITSNGGDVNAVISAAVQQATDEINQAVDDGRLTREQADTLIGGLEQVYTDAVNGELRDEAIERRVEVGVLELAAERTGLTPQDLRDELRGGTPLVDVLAAHDVDVNGFIDDVVARVEARLNVQVVDERITRERADELLAQFRAQLEERIHQSGEPSNAGVI
jgi:hypothetical protein